MTRPIQVIIVNFNTGDALAECVRSVIAQEEPVRVQLIDNASDDDSVERLLQSAELSAAVHLVRNSHNPGFATAVNQGLRLGSAPGQDPADYVLVLNPDCVLREGALGRLREALEADPGAALAAPQVTGPDGLSARANLRRFPGPWESLVTFSGLWRLGRWLPVFKGVEISDEQLRETGPADAVSGACMLIRRSALDAVEGMDEGYGLHCEDLDLMYRLRLEGWHCLYVPAARAVHRQGLSSGSRPVWAHWQKHRGMQRFYRKFQAADDVLPLRWLVQAGIWVRFALTLPLQLLRNRG